MAATPSVICIDSDSDEGSVASSPRIHANAGKTLASPRNHVLIYAQSERPHKRLKLTPKFDGIHIKPYKAHPRSSTPESSSATETQDENAAVGNQTTRPIARTSPQRPSKSKSQTPSAPVPTVLSNRLAYPCMLDFYKNVHAVPTIVKCCEHDMQAITDAQASCYEVFKQRALENAGLETSVILKGRVEVKQGEEVVGKTFNRAKISRPGKELLDIRAGDTVALLVDTTDNEERKSCDKRAESQSTSEFVVNERSYAFPAETDFEFDNLDIWFGRVIYFHNETVHVQWYERPTDFHAPNELLGMDSCDDTLTSCIVAKVDIKLPTSDDDAPIAHFIYSRFGVLHRRGAFVDLHKVHPPLLNPLQCPSCQSKDVEKSLQAPDHAMWLPIEKWTHHQLSSARKLIPVDRPEFQIAGNSYHVGQVVYLRRYDTQLNISDKQTYDIALITEACFALNEPLKKIKVRYLRRQSEVANNKVEFKDERELVLTDDASDVSPHLLEGHAWVECFSAREDADKNLVFETAGRQEWDFRWREDPNCYWIAEPIPNICTLCNAEKTDELMRLRCFSRRHKLNTYELFAGAGGLTEGLHQAGCFLPRFATEKDAEASTTFYSNHFEKGCELFPEDVNNSAIRISERLQGREGKCDKYPAPGEVDLIAMGPPCQPFSGANYNKKVADPRRALVFVGLTIVDMLKPKYVLIENVPEYIREPGNAVISNNQMRQRICQCLMDLGYQVQYGIINAVSYGAAQSRQRAIILAAKRGLTLPHLPRPTHMYRNHRQRKGVNLKMEFAMESVDLNAEHWPVQKLPCHSMPHAAVSFDDATSDLPPFGCEGGNHRVIIQGNYLAPPDDVYLPPRTSYQKAIRVNSESLQHHLINTPTVYKDGKRGKRVVGERKMAQLCALPPSTGHRSVDCFSLPKELQDPEWSTRKKSAVEGTLGRLHGSIPCNTITTSCDAFSARSWRVHPRQSRPVTARELLRIQGFPDSYHIHTGTMTGATQACILKQAGNAVNCFMAKALGTAIRDAAYGDYISRDKYWEINDDDDETVGK